MAVIDFHTHYYPPEYLKALEKGPSNVRIGRDRDGNPVLYYPGDYNVAVPGHRDIAFREDDVTGLGVDLQVLTITTPLSQTTPWPAWPSSGWSISPPWPRSR